MAWYRGKIGGGGGSDLNFDAFMAQCMYSSSYWLTALYTDSNGDVARQVGSGANNTYTGDFGDVGTWVANPTATSTDRLKVVITVNKPGTCYHAAYTTSSNADPTVTSQHMAAGDSWTQNRSAADFRMTDIWYFVKD